MSEQDKVMVNFRLPKWERDQFLALCKSRDESMSVAFRKFVRKELGLSGQSDQMDWISK